MTDTRQKVRDTVGIALTALDNGTPAEIAEMDEAFATLTAEERERVTMEINAALGIHPVCIDTASCED